MDPGLQEEPTTTTTSGHFLMGISYRDPNKKYQTEKERPNDMASVGSPVMASSFKPQKNPVIVRGYND